MTENLGQYLKPTYYLDFESSEVKEKAKQLIRELQTLEEIARAFFYFVRDQIKYRITWEDMFDKETFKASATLKRGYGFCIPKAILLASLLRVVSIPSRLHFADIRNHQLPPKILELLKTNLLIYHGYVELFLGSRWIKVNPAFDLEMCKKYDIIPVEFTGVEDALFHHLDHSGRLHIEYIADYGIFADFPDNLILSTFKKAYKHPKGFLFLSLPSVLKDARHQR